MTEAAWRSASSQTACEVAATFRAAISRHDKLIDEVVREQRIGDTPRCQDDRLDEILIIRRECKL
ncbi:MAG: hypothetical protein WBQ53_12240 [Methylocystis sp.]